jgi:nicotinamide mononucleotide adenylyltransferase
MKSIRVLETSNKQIESIFDSPHDLVVMCGKFQIASIYDHTGYQYMFNEAAKVSKNILIILGTSNEINRKNILTPEQRRAVIHKYFRETIPDAVLSVDIIYDCDDDNEWYFNINELVYNHCQYYHFRSPVYMGSRDSFLYARELLEYPGIELPSFGNYSSSNVRENIIRDDIFNADFNKGYNDFIHKTKTTTEYNCNRDYLRGYMLGYMDTNPIC